MTRRFDRRDDGDKLHMQSLFAIAHLDNELAGAHSYEQAFDVARRLSLRSEDIEQLFRRMLFNVVARNQDDHTKNIAFLMNKQGDWQLSPAFDVIYAYNPEGAWTSRHQMSINGRTDAFLQSDLMSVATRFGIGNPQEILLSVEDAVRRWSEYAGAAGVLPDVASSIAGTHRFFSEARH